MTTSHGAEHTAEFWDERYGGADRIWSGEANAQLVAVAGALAPGDGLDVGCGEGADAIWLAEAGWRVTAVDISRVALERGAQEAAHRAPAVAARISWDVVDVLTWTPPPVSFDLVSVQFMHLPRAAMWDLHHRLATALRPGGTLLIVLHHPDDAHHPGRAELMATAEEIGEHLRSGGGGAWSTVEAASPTRSARLPDGDPVTRRDAVLRAVRAAG